MKTLTPLLQASLADARNGRRKRSTVPVELPEGVRMDRKTGAFVLPKKPAQLADLLYATRELRLEKQRAIENLEKLESELRDWFVENLPRSQASGIAGAVARVQIELKPVPQVDDWTAFYSYVKKNDAFELLQRRLSEGAVKERLEEGKGLPGIVIFQAKKVSVTRL